ncbi:MAG: hypothetical protein LHW48_03930 [Candidatus Cloacimonetes bacterium]|nr:hypothetical protein [Candidatus Cloacimonadota bacterium]
MKVSDPYIEFTQNLKCLLKKYPDLITMTLSNIFTMRNNHFLPPVITKHW